MNRRDKTFTITFIISVLILLYYLGSSITGYVTQSMYCEKGVCREFCRFDSDCNANEICCQKDDFGVCEIASKCEKPYVFQPESVDIESIPPLERPAPTKGRIAFYSVLVVLAIIEGVIYFLRRKRR